MQAFEARSLDDPQLRRYLESHLEPGKVPAVRGWDLESLTLAAYFYSPQLEEARAAGAVADAAVQTASQRPNPTLQMPLEYTANAKPGESPYTLGLGLDLPIETAGKRGYRVAVARNQSIAARFEVGAATWQVRSRLRARLLEMFAAQRRGQVLERQQQLREVVTQMLDKRLALGATSAPEAQQAHAALVQLRAELAQARQQGEDARAAAAATIGLPLAALKAADIHLDAAFSAPAPELPAADVREQALLNRADVQAALAAYEASQAALQLEVANQYPDIHLGPGFTYDAGARKFALSPSGIALPLFNRNEGPIAQATARRQEAAAHFNVVQAEAITRADQAAQRFQAAAGALRLADSLLQMQLQQAAAAQRSLDAGSTDRLALALARLDEGNAELAHEDAMVRLQAAAGEIEDAMQRPLASPVGVGR